MLIICQYIYKNSELFFNTSEMVRSDISLSIYIMLQRKFVLSIVVVLYDK